MLLKRILPRDEPNSDWPYNKKELLPVLLQLVVPISIPWVVIVVIVNVRKNQMIRMQPGIVVNELLMPPQHALLGLVLVMPRVVLQFN